MNLSNKLEQPKIGYVQEGEGRGARAGVHPTADAMRNIETVSYWLVGMVTSIFIFVGIIVLVKVRLSIHSFTNSAAIISSVCSVERVLSHFFLVYFSDETRR